MGTVHFGPIFQKKDVKKDKKFILLVFFRIFAALFTNPGNR